METTNKVHSYISFLETINNASETESLYQDALKIISQIFGTNKVQVWEKAPLSNEMSIAHEYCEDKNISMLKLRVPLLPTNTKKTFEKINVWEYLNISNDFFNKYNIKSLAGIEFKLNEQKSNILILTSSQNNRQFNRDEIAFLIKLKQHLELSVLKIEQCTKSIDEVRRLQIQNNNLREQDRLRINFINNISHELRTPLASIVGFSKMLTSKNPKHDLKETTEQIQQAAKRLSTLIMDFLQINKIDSEGWIPNLEPTDVGELIKESTDELSSLYKNYKITYSISDDYPIIKSDPKLIRQVLDNLILNAIKYSPTGTSITVSLNTLKDKKELEISVSDKGYGIEKAETNKIFNRFYRSTDPNIQNIPGSGLGLAICKEIITILKGKIEVKSEIGKGSTFSFYLPTHCL